MKTIAAGPAAHIALGTNTVAHALKLTRDDGTILAITSHDVADTVDSVTYAVNPGLSVSSIVIQSGFAVGNGSVTFLYDADIFDPRALKGGVWRNAAFAAFRYNFVTLEVIEWLVAGTVGEIEHNRAEVIFELRDLRQALNVNVGNVRQPLAPSR
jgi:hypothetical protein